MNETKKNIVILPSWYPNETDIQLGIFIQRQALLMQPLFNMAVIYAHAMPQQDEKFRFVIQQTNSVDEIIVYFKQNTGPFRKIINARRYLNAQKKAFAQLNRSPDLVHVHVPYRSGIFALLLKRRNKTPFVVTEHWSGHLNGLFQAKSKLDKLFYKRFLAGAKQISTVSHALQKAFLKNTGFNSTVIPNYIEKQPIAYTKTNANQINLLSVGDFNDKTKNITGLLLSYQKAAAQNPNLSLTLVGGGPDEPKIRALAATLNLSPNQLKFTGRLPHAEVLKEMQKADFYVCNSRVETFGMTIAEALLAGIPVVSSPCGEPEFFLNEQNSILIPPESPDSINELAQAMLQMAEQYNTYDSAKIAQEIENQFGAKSVQEKWVIFYTQAMQPHSSAK